MTEATTSIDIGRGLFIKLTDRLKIEQSYGQYFGLTADVADRAIKHFAIDSPTNAKAEGRTSVDYWEDHADLTGSLMAKFAQIHGENQTVYRRVGTLHDADYLCHPHDAGPYGECHPIPLVKFLDESRVSPIISLSILEHAPYLKLPGVPSSRLSAALSACEDLATLISIHPRSEALDQLSPAALRLLEKSNVEAKTTFTSARPIRVAVNVEKYINQPLDLAIRNENFAFQL